MINEFIILRAKWLPLCFLSDTFAGSTECFIVWIPQIQV